MISFFVVSILVGIIILPIQSVALQANGQQNTSTSGRETQYWAFIVGIGEYAENPEQNRPDMILEANDFRDLLLQSPWWSEDHIRTITAENATGSNIYAGFRWLNKNVAKDDVVIVYLSTHGSYLLFDIPPREEADTYDEFLVTYWGFAFNTSIITDDQINIMLNRLKSDNVCLIVDSCYAGGFNDHWKILKSATEQPRVIIMASCEDEVSYSGGFAPYLIDGLRGYSDSNQDGIVTAEEVFAYAQPRSGSRQNPTMYDGYPGELALTTNTLSSVSSQRQGTLSMKPMSRLGISAETVVLQGYISGSGQPINNATVTVSARINYQQSYVINTTTTDPTGYYFMHVPAMRIRVTASAQGYLDETTNQFEVYENHTYWVNLTLDPRPPETAIVCGYITSEQNETPLIANVTLRWQGSFEQTYRNTTGSDVNGFYSMNVAPGYIDIDASKEGYFTESQDDLNITDSQILWINLSMYPLPLETSTVCGYITDTATLLPLPGVRIDVIWTNFSIEHQYSKTVQTNDSGFFSTPIAPGELYIDIRDNNYDYYDPYRHDALPGKPLWMNISLQQPSITVDIAKPLRAFYINNECILPWTSTRIIGPIDIEATSAEFFYGPGAHWEVQKVEFYIDGALKANATSEPYLYNWSARTLGRHTIKVVAYGFHNDTASKEIQVSKYL